MKILFTISILMMAMNIVMGQDQIITIEEDTIDCDIISIDKDSVHYKINQNGRPIEMLIAISEVASFTNNDPTEDNYVQKAISATDDSTAADQIEPKGARIQPSRLRVELNMGPGYMLVSGIKDLDPYIQPYNQNLRWGIQADAHLTWYFSKNIGVGLLASQFNTSNSEDLVQYNLDGTISTGQIQNDIRHQFYGVSYCTRSVPRVSKSSVHIMTSLGWMSYVNQGAFFFKYTERGSTLGLYAGLSYDFKIYKDFAIGAKLGAYLANLTTFEYDDGFVQTQVQMPEGQSISLSRVELGIGIRFVQ